MVQTIQTKRGRVEYRAEGSGPVVLVLNGGHTNCLSPFEHEKFFLEKGYRLLIPSRPGYGKTPSSSGKKAEAFADTLAAFLDALTIDKVIVMAISAGGRTALHFAKNHPDRVTKLILESAVTCEAWPDFGTRLGAMVLFNGFTEGLTWAMFRFLGRIAPDFALKTMMKSLSALKPGEAISCWDEKEREEVLKFLLGLRSGSGFVHDIKHSFECDQLHLVKVPALIIASSNDKSVSPLNSIKAAAQISGAELMMTPAECHLIWFSKYKKDVENKIADFIISGDS